MECPNCKEQIDDNAVICPKCGVQIKPLTTTVSDAPSAGYAILSFFLPIVGLILYFVWKDQMPLRAKSAGKGAIIGFVVLLLIAITYVTVTNIILSLILNHYN
ncbi:MAG: zinc ribbon domain-containing protein [Candidatus Borkfalkiaceae bacterium]|nr:zinc ribbon domain-containing protein [Christensenellaceae bacterium]